MNEQDVKSVIIVDIKEEFEYLRLLHSMKKSEISSEEVEV